MTRRRYVQRPDGRLEEVGDDYVPEPRARDQNPLAGDRHYAGLRAGDGADISTRSKHRAYMRRNGLTTMDDYQGEWAKAEREREKVFTGAGHDRADRLEAVISAWDRVGHGYKPRRAPEG